MPEANLFAYIDLEAFHKIISNLIDNGLKYCESSIKIELEETKEEDDQFTIKVISDGKPIPQEIGEKIFEPFFRAREADIKPGTGIGLSLSRALAELHNGSLTLHQPSADFNIFVLKLPIHQLIEFNLNDQMEKNLNITVLLVDDNEDIIDFITDDLSDQYNVRSAGNGLKALEILKSEPIQMVISDIMMP